MHTKSLLAGNAQTMEHDSPHIFILSPLFHEDLLHDNDLKFPNTTSGITTLFLWSENSVQIYLLFPAHAAGGRFCYI